MTMPDLHIARHRPSPQRRGRSRRLRSECHLFGNLVLDGKRVPTGPCWVHQSRQVALLCWEANDGTEHQREISLELLGQLLDEGVLERQHGA